MNELSLYSESSWNAFSDKILKQSKKKSYKHFDDVFSFEASSTEIKKMVEDPTLKKVATHSFIPLLKILAKTPRYRYDDSSDMYGLDTKIRPISFASHFDSYLYAYYAFVLTGHYQDYIKENSFDKCVLAYRSDLNGDCNIQFAGKAFDAVKEMVKLHGKCTAIALDIKGYFDSIDHQLLKRNWCKVLKEKDLPIDQYRIFRSLTAYSYVSKSSLLRHFNIKLDATNLNKNLLSLIPDHLNGQSFRQKFDLLRKEGLVVENQHAGVGGKGIPQGSPMSSVLSNIYLIDFDQWLTKTSEWMGFRYFRYCDDLLIICQSKDASYLLEKVIEEIKEMYHLEIQKKKSEIIEFRKNSRGQVRGFNVQGARARISNKLQEQKRYKNLQYLGFEFNGQNIYIRPSSLSRYFRKAKGRILKTMMMAYGKHAKSEKIYKKKIFDLYSHFGNRNFITYASNASKATYRNSSGVVRNGLNSPSIRRQLAGHAGFLRREMNKVSKSFSEIKTTRIKS